MTATATAEATTQATDPGSDVHRDRPARRRLAVEVKSLDASGAFSGYAAVFGVRDELDDVIEPGAFAGTLADWQARGTWPRVHWRHGASIGHVTLAREDERGLYVEGQLWTDHRVGAMAYGEMQSVLADPTGGLGVYLSFEYWAGDHRVEGGVRYLATVELGDDITLTTNPVNREAELIELKSGDVPSIRQAEQRLREAGFSRAAAKAVLAGGYGALRDAAERKGDDPDDEPAGGEALRPILEKLQSVNHGSADDNGD
jgi:hypothetical protein